MFKKSYKYCENAMLKQIFSGRKHGKKTWISLISVQLLAINLTHAHLKMRLMMNFAEIAENNLIQKALSLKLFLLGILIIN